MLTPDLNNEIEVMADFSYDESDGDLKVLIKHDYYSSNNDLGISYLNSYLDSLLMESDRLCLLIIIDSAVKLLENNAKLHELINRSPSTIICNNSLEHYGIHCELNNSSIILLELDDVIDTIINSSPNIIIE
ncbi:MAG: hypothetical protein MJ094_09385 [Saccharofermentans sp.]|nr:hypothetical protein [Saccharofermentans sp.]